MSSLTSRKKEKIEKEPSVDPEAQADNTMEKYYKRKHENFYRFVIFIEVLIIIATTVTLLRDFLHAKERQTQRIENESSLQKSIEDLRGTILQHKDELEKITKHINIVEHGLSGFCSNCKIIENKGDLNQKASKERVTCLERLEFLVQLDGDKEEVVKENLIQKYPMCKKKKIKSKEEDEIEIELAEKKSYIETSEFCPECSVKMSNGDDVKNHRKTCKEYLEFKVSKYNEHENHLKARLAQTHRECFNKNEIEYFCSQCTYAISVDGVSFKQTCQSRLSYVLRKYGERENDVKKELMDEHPECRENE